MSPADHPTTDNVCMLCNRDCHSHICLPSYTRRCRTSKKWNHIVKSPYGTEGSWWWRAKSPSNEWVIRIISKSKLLNRVTSCLTHIKHCLWSKCRQDLSNGRSECFWKSCKILGFISCEHHNLLKKKTKQLSFCVTNSQTNTVWCESPISLKVYLHPWQEEFVLNQKIQNDEKNTHHSHSKKISAHNSPFERIILHFSTWSIKAQHYSALF